MRIRALETDIHRLLDENLGLRTELIQTKCSLARQSTSSTLIESARFAQQALEKVLLDVAGIKSNLEDSLQTGIPSLQLSFDASSRRSEYRHEQRQFPGDQESRQRTTENGPEIRSIQRRTQK